MKPSSVDLNDTLDIVDYVKILKVAWGDMLDSEYIKGVVLKKGTADKWMT